MNRFVNSALIGACLAGAFALGGFGAEVTVSSGQDIAKSLASLQPGDVLVMTNGAWKDQSISFKSKGLADKPITLRAQTPGKVILTGKSTVAIDGENLVVSGLLLKDGTGTGDGITLAGTRNRLTESVVIGGKYKYFVHMRGTENRLDHCYLAGKTTEGPTLQIEVEGKPNRHRVDHNHFGPRPPLRRNGGETIRIGYSHQSLTNSSTIVEMNLFDRCDGELEIISNKSCDNIYRHNTFLDCGGMLTLRHGNRCTIDGNFFFGHQKRSSGGIRIIGEDHVIVNNCMEGIERGGFWITAGVPNSALAEYFQAKRCLIAFNTMVDCKGPAIEVDAGYGSSKRKLRPMDIDIANNLFSMPQGQPLLKGTEGEGFRWIANIASGGLDKEHPGILIADPKLKRNERGIWRLALDSPARGAAKGGFRHPWPSSDIFGRLPFANSDIGCEQKVFDRAIEFYPMSPENCGPQWMARTAGEPAKGK